MKGKLCVITGATSGIGEATALDLGKLGADLILVGRDERRGESVVRKVSRLSKGGMARFIRLDLASPPQIRAAASIITSLQRPVDVLINNAGVRLDHYQENDEGHELTFATNHLGHFLLTGLLLERIIASDQGRIITVSSGSHGSARADGEWELRENNFDRRQAYAKSKLANLLFAYELARRLAGTNTLSCAFDPGGVASNFARYNGLWSWGKHLLSHALRRELVSPKTAASALVHLAVTPSLPSLNGAYYHRREPLRSSPASYEEAAARKLWALSLALTGLTTIQGPYAG